MLGKMKLPLLTGKYFEVTGGPYKEADLMRFVGVKMAKEINLAADVNVPTVDFSVPKVADLTKGIREAVGYIVNGYPVYVGCMGGKGRTGLFMAILAKAWGIDLPVKYVRANYYSHAVETEGQYEFVKNYKVPRDVVQMVRRAKIMSPFGLVRNKTNYKKLPGMALPGNI